jgi:hypothetical protein
VLVDEQQEETAREGDEGPAAELVLPPARHVDRKRRDVGDRNGPAEGQQGPAPRRHHPEPRDGPMGELRDHVVAAVAGLGERRTADRQEDGEE